MVDNHAKKKKRAKLQKLVADKLAANPELGEVAARKEVMRQLRELQNARRAAGREEAEQLAQKIRTEMEGQEESVIRKAVAQAVAKFHSKKKKEKRNQLKIKANEIVKEHLEQKWCPVKAPWWDRKCQESFDSLYLLGAMMDMNIEKSTTAFAQKFPEECEKHFNLLAKRRFKNGGDVGDPTADAEAVPQGGDEKEAEMKKQKKKKSVLARSLAEKMAAAGDSKSEQDLVLEVVAELKAKEKKMQLKMLRKTWFPVNQPWYDEECKAASKGMLEKAEEHGLDLKTKAAHYKRLKALCRLEAKAYFQLLNAKKAAHNPAEDKKKKKKKVTEAIKTEAFKEEPVTANKRITFCQEEEEAGTESKPSLNGGDSPTKQIKKKKKKEKDGAGPTPKIQLENANGEMKICDGVSPKKKKKSGGDDSPAEKEINYVVKNFKMKQIKKKKREQKASMG